MQSHLLSILNRLTADFHLECVLWKSACYEIFSVFLLLDLFMLSASGVQINAETYWDATGTAGNVVEKQTTSLLFFLNDILWPPFKL